MQTSEYTRTHTYISTHLLYIHTLWLVMKAWNGLPFGLGLTPVAPLLYFSQALRPHCLTEVGLGSFSLPNTRVSPHTVLGQLLHVLAHCRDLHAIQWMDNNTNINFVTGGARLGLVGLQDGCA